jgi:hypothetical protein
MKRAGTYRRQKADDLVLGVISEAKAGDLLRSLANMPPKVYSVTPAAEKEFGYEAKWRAAVKRLFKLYPGVFDFVSERWLDWTISRIRLCVQRVWDAPNAWEREWWVFMTRYLYERERQKARITGVFHFLEEGKARQFASALIPRVPDPSAFEAALFHASLNATKLLHCLNPGCPAPYFLRSRKGQRYCSEACAIPSRKASKRLWWARNRGKNDAR